MNNQVVEELAHAGETSPPPVPSEVLDLGKQRITADSHLPPVEFLFRMFGIPCFPRGELVGVAGKAKSGKTLFTSMLMAMGGLTPGPSPARPNGTLSPERTGAEDYKNEGSIYQLPLKRECEEPHKVFWYDTEQSESSTQEILRERIVPMAQGQTDSAFWVFNVRSIHWSRRMNLLEKGVDYYHPDLVVVDGIRDLVDDINNGVQAQDTIERLMQLASNCHCCIVCVLHQNKGAEDRNLRGWIGTELMNKAFEVYSCEKLMPERIFSVEQTLTRKYDIEQLMYFRVDEHGLPIVSEPPASAASGGSRSSSDGDSPLNREYIIPRQNGFEVDLRRLFHEVLKNGPRYYSDLQTAAMRELNSHELGFWNKQFALARDQGIIVRTFNRNNKCVWALPMSQQMQPTLFDGTDTVSADAPPF